MRLAIALMFTLAVSAWGQTANTGTVVGRVTDPSGAIVTGAAVQLQDAATGEVRSVVSNSTGRYAFVAVLPGKYS